MSRKKLILFDWDNTIATGTGEINESRLKIAIQLKIRDGWYIGLNSDTPLQRLQAWWNMLEMNGPIVAEKGAVVWWPEIHKIVISQTANIFHNVRDGIIASLTKESGVGMFIGDSTRFIRSIDRWDGDDNLLVAFDAYRLCSIGLFVRRIKNGEPCNDIESVKRIYEIVKRVIPSDPLISPVNINTEYGFISVSSLDTDKTKGVRELLRRWGANSYVIMIGDSIADYLALPQITHFAVGNAQDELKEKSAKVAKKDYSEGCIELLASM